MTAAEHLAVAEAYLGGLADPAAPDYTSMAIAITLNALTHAVAAVAIELGVPHGDGASGQVPSGSA